MRGEEREISLRGEDRSTDRQVRQVKRGGVKKVELKSHMK